MNKNIFVRFISCGLLGWCFECFWTGLGSIRKGEDKTLRCNTSLWMFPIYGLAAFISPFSRLLKNRNALSRGLIYTLLIFTAEFCSGNLLKKYDACPWDYSKAKLNYKGVVRLDYAPLWFCIGLIYEQLARKTANSNQRN